MKFLLFLLLPYLVESDNFGFYKKITSNSLTWIPRTSLPARSQIECGSVCSLDPTCSAFIYKNGFCYIGDKYSMYNGIVAGGMREVYVPLNYSGNGFAGLLTTTTTPPPPTTPYSPGCFYQVTSPGKISSPGYPSNYANSLLCGWEIVAPTTQTVKITFNDFGTESCCDFVSLFNNFNVLVVAATVPVYKFSGLAMPSPKIYQTNGNVLTVKFKTDGSVTRQGFDASITFV